MNPTFVIPAKAGTQLVSSMRLRRNGFTRRREGAEKNRLGSRFRGNDETYCELGVIDVYPQIVLTRPITVAETLVFMRSAAKIWSEAEVVGLVDHVARNPEAGDLIPGTGGVRKIRWGRSGSGKRGGARVIYFYYHPDCPLYLLLAYAKAQASDLTPDEKKAVAALATAIRVAHPQGDER